MLKPSELAQAQGFPEHYEFASETKTRKTKLIGNAVPVSLAKSLCKSLLQPTNAPTLNNFGSGPSPAADSIASSDD